MEFGEIEYVCRGTDERPRTVVLRLVGEEDEVILRNDGIAALRRRRILRLAGDARKQGCLLSYDDLCALLSTSLSTIKRDVVMLERMGNDVPLRKRRHVHDEKDEHDYSLADAGGRRT